MVGFNVACIQMNSGPNMQENLIQAGRLITDAANAGADFVVTPENTDFMRATADMSVKSAKPLDGHVGVEIFSSLAKDLGIWLLIGSMKIKLEDNKVANRSFLFNDKGMLKASYDKIHLFDAELPNGEEYKESDFTQAGDKAVVSDTPWGNVGLSICYDVRFPYLYRDMAQAKADFIVVPSAFTQNTGEAHWETLLRARAIETGSYILAPAQLGEHEGGRKTYGHSMIIDPWGKILAEIKEAPIVGPDEDSDESPATPPPLPGFIMKEIDTIKVVEARKAIPSLTPNAEYKLLKPKLL